MTALLPTFASTHKDIAPLVGRVHHADALELLARLPDGSVDAVITDPPYAEISRDYGRLSEDDWMLLMVACVKEFRRVLKPSGSAVMVIQPNSEKVGKMRLWVWKFMVWCGEYWNIIQDVYWHNSTQPPTVHTQEIHGLMRPSVKQMVWIGEPSGYRNQLEVLRPISKSLMNKNNPSNITERRPSGYTINAQRIIDTAIRRGGTTPFNLIDIANANSTNSAGSHGHGAGTPYELMAWWVRYICPPDGVVLDPFMGSGTTALACNNLNRRYIGCDLEQKYVDIARRRLAQPYTPDMFAFAATG